MGDKKPKKKPPTPRDMMKMEIARELGLWERIEAEGWENLSGVECGRVGGIMSHRLKGWREKQ